MEITFIYTSRDPANDKIGLWNSKNKMIGTIAESELDQLITKKEIEQFHSFGDMNSVFKVSRWKLAKHIYNITCEQTISGYYDLFSNDELVCRIYDRYNSKGNCLGRCKNEKQAIIEAIRQVYFTI